MAKDFSRDFYNTNTWKDLRRQILRRDLYTCQWCGARANEVHHIIELTPENIGTDIAYDIENLVSLCHQCHTSHHKGLSDLQEGYIFNQEVS